MVRIKAVVFNHNQRTSAERLYTALSKSFDVALFDSGSRVDEVSDLTTHKFPNLFWTGCWNKCWELFPDHDVIWGLGGDCELRMPPGDYLQALQSCYPFGLWSPAIEGHGHEYMKPDGAEQIVLSVLHLEGMAFAISRDLWSKASSLDEENYIGHGQDLYLAYLSRRHNLKNFLDCRVKLFHPQSSQYDLLTARNLMMASLRRLVGEDWCDVMNWWWGRRVPFKANAVSRLELNNGERRLIRPFITM